MWKILGLLLFGSLLHFSEGKKVAIISMFSFAEYESIVGNQLKLDGLLQDHLKKMVLGDIPISGLLGLLKITGLNIAQVEITKHKLNYVPGLRGGEVVNGIRLSIGGSLLGGIPSLVKISLEFQFAAKYELTDFEAGFIKLVLRECNIFYGNINIEILHVNLSPSALSAIKDSIFANINQQCCKILNVVFNVVKDRLLETMNVVIPFEPYGSLKFQMATFPETVDNILWLNLFLDFDIRGQGLLSIPDSAPDITLPSLVNYRHCQCVHAAVFDIFLSVVLRIQPQELSCTPDVFSGADELRAAILALIPDPPSFISSAILYLRISLLQSPVIHFGNDVAIVQASVQLEFFVRNPEGFKNSIVILQESLSLSASFSVIKGYLYVSLSFSGHKAVLISSALGITDVSSLEPHCGKLLGETFLASVNGFLSVGLRLPAILTAVLDKVLIRFIEHGLLLCV